MTLMHERGDHNMTKAHSLHKPDKASSLDDDVMYTACKMLVEILVYYVAAC